MREPVARIVNRGARFAPGGVNARGIPEMFLEKRPHRFARWCAEWRGRVVIEINQADLQFAVAIERPVALRDNLDLRRLVIN